MKNMRILKVICFIAIFSVLTIGGHEILLSRHNQALKDDTLTKKPEEVEYYKTYYKDMGDDWYYRFSIQIIGDKTLYYFNGYNLKYNSITELGEDPYLEMSGDTFTDEICLKPTLQCSVKINENMKVKEEIQLINDYFNKKQFDKQITLTDVEDLTLENFDKSLIVELYNGAQEQKYTDKKGQFRFLKEYEYFSDDFDDGYMWSVSLFTDCDLIVMIKLNIRYEDGTFLSDKVENGSATEEEKELYQNIKYAEYYIRANQKTDVEEYFKKYDNYMYQRLDRIFEQFYTKPQNR